MNRFFNAQHSPIGAQASFTLGHLGAKGGIAHQLGKPADQSVYIGLESSSGGFEMLPFYEGSEDAAKRYTGKSSKSGGGIRAFPQSKIGRVYRLSTDSFKAGDLEFKIYTPLLRIPDIDSLSPRLPKGEPYERARVRGGRGFQDLRRVLLPAVLCELIVDNRRSKRPRKAVFGWNAGRQMRELRGKLRGVAAGAEHGIASLSPSSKIFQDFSIETLPNGDRPNHLGHVGGLVLTAPPGRISSFPLAVGFYKNGQVTTGVPASYYYTELFEDLEDVLGFALKNFSFYKKAAQTCDRDLDDSSLSEDEKFLVSHSARSYYGSTELLMGEPKGGRHLKKHRSPPLAERGINRKPLWVVNEGEYLMMNTFDLSVDQVFFEMRMNPWVVRNVLDQFLDRYSYTDQLGLSFTHDMGVNNQFSPKGYSSYERPNIDGCFSYMTHEQLCNWVLTASVYVEGSGDRAWLKKRLPVLESCFESLLRRDHPNPKKRDGIMSFDSSRCEKGSEITTYDSLDHSLCPSKGSSYIAMKSWASCLALEKIFRDAGKEKKSLEAFAQARLVADTLVDAYTAYGFVPAVLPDPQKSPPPFRGDPGTDTGVKKVSVPRIAPVTSRIIPVIEGLIYPHFNGCRDVLDFNGPFGDLLRVLRAHTAQVLKPKICLFPDGGWKLSSTSDNSWMSKIALNMFIAGEILGLELEPAKKKAQKAHVEWQCRPGSAYWAMSDQMVKGLATGSKYYPRMVTTFLWYKSALPPMHSPPPGEKRARFQ